MWFVGMMFDVLLDEFDLIVGDNELYWMDLIDYMIFFYVYLGYVYLNVCLYVEIEIWQDLIVMLQGCVYWVDLFGYILFCVVD